jgi:membrane fusion protein (multidrug efflux system)
MRAGTKWSLLILGSALAIAFVGCEGTEEQSDSEQGEGQASGGRAFPVEAIAAAEGRLLEEVSGSGLVRGTSEVTVISETEGTIAFVDFRLGEFVEQGRPLTGVDDTVARLNFEQAVEEAERARLDLQAVERRFANGNASEAELSRARSAERGARARRAQARETLDNQTLEAPIAGFVAERGDGIVVGNFLQRGSRVARIVDLSRVEVEISVGEREVRFIEEGSPATVITPSCSLRERPAEVGAIAAGSDLQTGSFPVVVSWDRQCEDVRSGVSASVRIEPTEQALELIVPASAVEQEEDQAYLFVAEDGVARRREIRLGERLGNRAVVLEGVEPGELVLVSGLTVVSDGSAIDVTVREEAE